MVVHPNRATQSQSFQPVEKLGETCTGLKEKRGQAEVAGGLVSVMRVVVLERGSVLTLVSAVHTE